MSGVEFSLAKGAWNLQHLETLNLNDNHFFRQHMPEIFSRMRIIKVSNLTHLYLQNVSLQFKQFNEVVDIGWVNLKTLKVDRNDITNIYVDIHSKMPKLETLSVTENQLLSTTNMLVEYNVS